MLTDEEAISLIEKIRRAQPNNRELWRLLDDHELRIYSKAPETPLPAMKMLAGPVKDEVSTDCPVCDKRKKAKAKTQKKWRENKLKDVGVS